MKEKSNNFYVIKAAACTICTLEAVDLYLYFTLNPLSTKKFFVSDFSQTLYKSCSGFLTVRAYPYCWKPELAKLESVGIIEISRSVLKILAKQIIFLTAHLQFNFFFTFCDIKRCKTIIFEQNFNLFSQFRRNTRLSSIGQKITVGQSGKVAGPCRDPW